MLPHSRQQCRRHQTASGSRIQRVRGRRVQVCKPVAQINSKGGRLPASVLESLQRHGDHAKGAYVLFGQFNNNQQVPVDIQGTSMLEQVSRGSTADPSDKLGPLGGLDGFTGVGSLMGYPGKDGVLTVPTPLELDQGLLGIAAVGNPSFVGYISKRRGEDGVLELVVSFRGSSIQPDWVTNLLGGVATDKLFGKGNGRVHQGFFNLLHEIPEGAPLRVSPIMAIDAALAAEKELPRVITTGHSLGGALAIVAALSIAQRFPDYRQDNQDYTKRKLQTYTFAAPRAGDVALSAYMTNTLHYSAVQVKNIPDVVPYVPPRGLSDLRGTIKKLLGMRGRAQPTASDGLAPAAVNDTASADEADIPTDTGRWLAYEQLLTECGDDPNKLQQLVHELQEQSGSFDLAPAASLNFFQRFTYAAQLLNTVQTPWSDTPVPSFGACEMNAPEAGRWGGRNHSLEVYLKNLATLVKP